MTARLPGNIEDAYPLAPLQSGMLFYSVASPGSGVYIEQLVVRLHAEDLEVEAFKQAWATLTARHPVLRTAFVWENIRQPLQVVHKSAELTWTERDFRNIDGDTAAEALADYQDADRLNDFDLQKPPLQRMALVRSCADEFIWIWTRHHIIADGWSTSILLRELSQLYSAVIEERTIDLPPIRPYRDYISSLSTGDDSTSSSFWKSYLDGIETPLLLAERVLKPGVTQHDGEVTNLHQEETGLVSQHDTELLQSLCRNSRVTLNTAVQAAWCLLLERYAGQPDITWGSTFSGRSGKLDGAEQIVGLLINTVPLRQRVNPGQSVKEFLRVVQANLLSVMEYEQTALSDIQSLGPLGSGIPLFDTVVVFENYPRNAPDDDVFGFGRIEYKEQSNLPLALIAIPGKRLELIFIYDSCVFSGSFCRKLLSQLITLLAAMARDEFLPVGHLPVLTTEETDTLLAFSQRSPIALDDGPGPLCPDTKFIDIAISKRASENPEAIAIRFLDRSIRYGELEAISNTRAYRISEILSQRGVDRNQCVIALHLPRSEDVIVWMIAVLKAGAAYLVLDQSQPVKNLEHILESSATELLITDGTQSDLNENRLLALLDICSREIDMCCDSGEPGKAVTRMDTDTAYILYTSGSTGQPKGVAVSHKNLLASIQARFTWYDSIPGSYLLLSPLSFDSSVAGVYWTLTAGGTLVVSPLRLEQDMLELAGSIDTYRITHTLCLPSIYRLLLETVEQVGHVSKLASLNTIITAGEVVQPLGLLDRHQRLLPDALLVNEYGPTEATVWCCAAKVSGLPFDAPVPIGRPVGNNHLYVLDHLYRLAPLEALGQLVIAGDQLSPGYWRDQALTTSAFQVLDITPSVRERVYLSGDQARWREDGNLDFLGRNDGQVKIRGHRVELAGIESSLCMDAWIDEAAVFVIPGPDVSRPARHRLAAIVVVTSNMADEADPVSAIRERLCRILPQYMVPSVIEIRDSLPKLPNGKIDRRSLVLTPNSKTWQLGDSSPPETDRERQLHRIWQELLGLEHIGIDDNFFELGGDSIMSIRLLSSLFKAGFNLDPNAVFETPSIRGLAVRIQSLRQRDITRAPPLEPARQLVMHKEFGTDAEYVFDLSESQSAYLFSWMRTGQMDPGHVQVQATVTGQFEGSLFEEALECVVHRHEALRTAIYWRNRDTPVQVVYRKIETKWSQIAVGAEDSQIKVDEYLAEDRTKRLPLDTPQVWRIQVFRIPGNRTIVCWSFHHSLVDGWSAAIVIRSMVEEMRRLTRIASPGSGPGPNSHPDFLLNPGVVRYRDYLYWLSKRKQGVEESKWKDYMAQLGIDSFGLPLQSGLRDSTTSSVSIVIRDADWELLRKSISRYGITVSRLVHACWGLVLSIASGNRTLGFSTTVSGRNIPIEGAEEVVGQFVNHLPVFFESGDRPDVAKILGNLSQAFALISGSEHVPASRLMSWSGSRGKITTCTIDGFEVPSLVMVENFPWNDSSAESDEGIMLSSFQRRGDASSFNESGRASVFPVTLVVVPESDRLQLQLHFRESLFERNSAYGLLQAIYAVALQWSQDGAGQTDSSFESAVFKFFSAIAQKVNVETLVSGGDRAPESAVEKALSAIWSRLFDQQVNDVHLNFFSLGGTSLVAVSMVESVRKDLGIRLPLSLLIEHPTIESLAAAISEDKHKTSELLVTIQSEGRCKPVFGIHAEGNVLFYQPLANILGKEQPFYGVQTPELVNVDLRFDSVQEIAVEYIRQIRKVQPEGPYSIVGMCFGGWIAFEMANQLRSMGERVDLLCVLDSDAPGQPASASQAAVEESGRNLWNAPKTGDTLQSSSTNTGLQSQERKNQWKDKFRYHREAPLLIKVLTHIRTGRLLELSVKFVESSAPVSWIKKSLGRDLEKNESLELIRRIRDNQDRLIREYVPETCETDIVFIFSEQFNQRPDSMRQIRHWSSLCQGKFEYHVVSGNHLAILDPPHVEEVAAIIGRRVPANKIDR